MERLLRATARAEARHFWFRGFRAFVGPLIRIATAGRTVPLILDCGCGTGANVEWLAAFGRSCGFDVSEAGLRIGLEAGRRRLLRASVTAAPFPCCTFDVITSFDVLYSLEDDAERRAIAEMFRMLKPGGCAIVNVAAMPLLRGDHSVVSQEVRRYTRRELRGRLEAGGFTVERITYTNATLFAPMAVVRYLQRRRGLRDDAREIAVPAAPLNAALTSALRLEAAWIRHFDMPFGSSLLCLARKP